MGVAAQHHVWGGDAHLLQEFAPAPHGLRLGATASAQGVFALPQSLVQEQRLTELICNGEHRIERRQRLLEDHRDTVTPDMLQRRFIGMEELRAGKADAPRRMVTTGWLDEA